MSDKERMDAFFARLEQDPETATLAVMLGPYRFMTPANDLVALIDRLVEHWQFTAPLETKT